MVTAPYVHIHFIKNRRAVDMTIWHSRRYDAALLYYYYMVAMSLLQADMLEPQACPQYLKVLIRASKPCNIIILLYYIYNIAFATCTYIIFWQFKKEQGQIYMCDATHNNYTKSV